MQRLIRLPVAALRPLEDRYADALIDDAVAAGACAIVATTPRAWIDLNRSEREFDPAIIADAPPGLAMVTRKVRGGLGIVPRHLAAVGDIWRHSISFADFETRIARDHRPYHAALATALAHTVSRFGHAVLIDLHSMPPLTSNDGPPPQIIIGDRFGKSASHRITEQAASIAAGHGYRTAINLPYAGGHILDRHGAPARGVDAIQIEIARDAYLDKAFDRPSTRLADARKLMAAITVGLSKDCSAIAGNDETLAQPSAAYSFPRGDE